MDYEKKYKDALERARAKYAMKDQPIHQDLVDIFPELKESEDELTWLTKYIEEEAYSLSMDIRDNEDRIKLEKLQRSLAWLEKKGKQETLCDKCKKEQPSHSCQDITALGRCALEMQGEKKPADKVELKFKAGDWVVNMDGKVNQVVAIDNDCDGFTLDDDTYFSGSCKDIYRLWTIEDAKGGDVLSFNDGHGNDCIELIKSITGKKIEFWFCLTNGNRYEVFDGITPYTNLISREDATPATKEQRKQLEKAMADAGYTFDFEKKELKKSKPFDKFEGLTDFERTLADICIGWIGEEYGWKQYIKDNADVLLKIAIEKFNSVQDAPFEQTTAWSEEDERMLENIISSINHESVIEGLKIRGISYSIDSSTHLMRNLINWLQSLKNRHTWKPSDEHMEALEHFIIHHNGSTNYAKDLEELRLQLKKLREE